MHHFPRRGGRGMGGQGRGAGFGSPRVGRPPPISDMSPPLQTKPPETPFDFTMSSHIFPRGMFVPDDAPLTEALLKRNQEITPSADEMQAMQTLVNRVQTIIENIILSPGTLAQCEIDEIRLVGSFKQGTILAGHRSADFVVILKTLPTKTVVEALHNKVAEVLKETECLRSTMTEYGFDLTNVQGTVRILVTTVVNNMRRLDPAVHLDGKILSRNGQAIRHSRWVEENANGSTIKVLIRILRDIRSRFEEFKALPALKLDLLAHFSVTNTVELEPLSLGSAFRRAISLMSTGIFLPTYSATTMRGIDFTPISADKLTAAAQNMLLLVSQGRYHEVLGLTPYTDILDKIVVGSIVIQAQQLVCDSSTPMDFSQDMDIEEVSLPSQSVPVQV